MIIPTPVPFKIAKFLSKEFHSVAVYEPASGAIWDFDDDLWENHGLRATMEDIIDSSGECFMDINYIFVWMNPVTH